MAPVPDYLDRLTVSLFAKLNFLNYLCFHHKQEPQLRVARLFPLFQVHPWTPNFDFTHSLLRLLHNYLFFLPFLPLCFRLYIYICHRLLLTYNQALITDYTRYKEIHRARSGHPAAPLAPCSDLSYRSDHSPTFQPCVFGSVRDEVGCLGKMKTFATSHLERPTDQLITTSIENRYIGYTISRG